MRLARMFALAVALGAVSSAGGRAQEAFYRNKTISVICAALPGDSYDLYARFIANNIGRFIPGEPKVVVENRVGAASRTATTYVFNTAPQDGTVIGNSSDILPFDQVIHPPEGRFDLTKAQFLGNLVALTGVIAISSDANVATLDDLQQRELIIGSSGTGSITYIAPTLIKALSGAKFRIVPGYASSAETDLAIARGEVHARGGSWQSFRALHPDWVASGRIRPMVQLGIVEDPFMRGVPRLIDYAKTDEQKAVYTALSEVSRFSRAYWVSPQVPAERVAMLRKAFMDMATNPDVLAEAARQTIEIQPTKGEELAVAVKGYEALTPAMVDHMRQILK